MGVCIVTVGAESAVAVGVDFSTVDTVLPHADPAMNVAVRTMRIRTRVILVTADLPTPAR